MPKKKRISRLCQFRAKNPLKRKVNFFDSKKWSKIIQEGRLQGAIRPHPASFSLPDGEGAILIYRSGAEPIARLKGDADRLERLCRHGFDENR